MPSISGKLIQIPCITILIYVYTNFKMCHRTGGMLDIQYGIIIYPYFVSLYTFSNHKYIYYYYCQIYILFICKLYWLLTKLRCSPRTKYGLKQTETGRVIITFFYHVWSVTHLRDCFMLFMPILQHWTRKINPHPRISKYYLHSYQIAFGSLHCVSKLHYRWPFDVT